MKSLQIKLINPEGRCVERILSRHMDVTNRETIFYSSFIIGKTYPQGQAGTDYHCIKHLNHWHIMDGLITLFYDDGYCLEINRINND